VIVDATAQSLSPGLIDAHQHFFSPPLPYTADVGARGWGKLAEEFMSDLRNARRDSLTAGVTTTVDLGGRADTLPGWQEKIAAGMLSPRMRAAGPILTAPGGHPHGTLFRGQHDLEEHAVVLLDGSPGEARAAVDALADQGVALIKLAYTAGSAAAPLPRLELGLAEAAIAQAHARGLRAVAHVTTAAEAADMVQAGIDGLEHSFPVPDGAPLFAEMAARGVVWTPTLGLFAAPGVAADPALLEAASGGVARAARAGVPIAAGSDYPGSGGWRVGADLHRELSLLEATGLPRAAVLSAATATAAQKLGGAGEGLGCVAAGCVADMVLWDGDLQHEPLEPARVAQVWLRGEALLDAGAIADAHTHSLREKNKIFAPYAFYDPVAGVMLGASASHFDILDSGVAADLGLQASLRGRLSVSTGASIPSPIPHTDLSARLGYDGLPTSWFGGGNATVPSAQQNYTPDAVKGSVGLGHQRGSWRLGGGLSAEALRTDLAALPGGLGAAVRLTGAHDTRDSETEPWRGGTEILSAEAGATRAGGFTTARLDLRRYVSPLDWHTLAVRLLAEQASDGTPWWRLPELSSSSGVGRGFLPDRFADQHLLAAQAEIRSRIWRSLGAAGFVDVGQVAGEWGALRADSFHVSPGASLRVRINAQVTLCWDVGFGLEPDAPTNWVLLYRSGHPF